MKKIIISFLLSFFALSAYAQNQEMDVETLKMLFKTEKRIVVKDNMNLSVEEAKIFWPHYDEYELERSKLMAQRTEIIKRYVEKYDLLSNQDLDLIIKDITKINKSENKMKSKYYKKMKKELGTKTAARFFQIDSQINNILKVSIQQEVPLISNLK